MEKHFAEYRRKALAHAQGRVLEIGGGTGFNLPHYPSDIEELVVTEPAPGMLERARRRAATSALPVTVRQASAEALPFDDASFDTVVSTLVLCSVDDVDRALAEIHRVLRPGGQLIFVEHVRWEDPAAREVAGPARTSVDGARGRLPPEPRDARAHRGRPVRRCGRRTHRAAAITAAREAARRRTRARPRDRRPARAGGAHGGARRTRARRHAVDRLRVDLLQPRAPRSRS